MMKNELVLVLAIFGVLYLVQTTEGACDEVSLKYLGCYQDGSPKLLPGSKIELQDNTPRNCVNLCLRSGYKYAGVQYSKECFCGDTVPPNSAILSTDDKCNMACPQSPSIKCGGSNTMNVYDTGLPDVSLKNLGCYKDDEGTRLLPDSKTVIDENTPRRCVEKCLGLGYQFAGVEFATECFCSNTAPPNTAILVKNDCNMPCPKSPSFRCGGSYAIDVYNTGLSDVVSLKYLGCYQDGSPRLFPKPQTILPDNTPRNCVTLCLRSGYKYAGVQYSNECFCGDTTPPNTAMLSTDDKCNLPCPKSPSIKCGGTLTMNVYETGLQC